ncbi:hypothetical protein KC343_g8209, partial [Hortaea werneckii]
LTIHTFSEPNPPLIILGEPPNCAQYPLHLSATANELLRYPPPRDKASAPLPRIAPSPTMKPVVSAFNAWTCIVISVFAIVILSAIGSMFAKGHHTMMGSEEDPKDGGKVAAAVFGAVAVYGAFLVFCGLQALLHKRQSRQGEIALR